MAYKTVEIPTGSFIGWGTTPGQFVEGTILDYDENAGTDFAGEPCPSLDLKLVEKASSFNKKGERTFYEPGDLVTVTCGLRDLKKRVRAADPKRGNMIKITMTELVAVDKGDAKHFKVEIDDEAGAVASSGSAAGFDADDSSDPPF